MTNFSSFFPAAGGGGGGFTKMNKYSTFRALDDATHKQAPALSYKTNENKTTGATTMQFNTSIGSSSTNSFTNVTNSMAGYKFTHNSTEHTITANPAFTQGYDFVLTFTPALTANLNYNNTINFTTPLLTVNPATDLGLEDGASLGYFMVGSGMSVYDGSGNTGRGGKIIYGTKIITNASTDLILTPATSPPANNNMVQTESTISGGITLTTGNGYNGAGFGFDSHNTSNIRNIGTGVMGYGFGGGEEDLRRFPRGDQAHGFGGGGAYLSYQNFCAGGDGSILLYY